MELIGIILSAIFISNSITCFIEWGINKIKISNKYKKKGIDNQIMLHIKDSNGNEMSSEASIDGKHNLQIVYKIDGDFTGDIKGDNIIVILMNGDVNGDISSKEGDVVLIKGNIDGDVKANKVICQQPKSDYENYIDKLSNIDKLSKPDKEDEAHCVCANPNTNCAKCAWFDYVSKECKSWDANEGECQFIDKYESRDKVKDSFRQLPPDYVRCADCVYAEDYSSNMYRCSKYDGVVVKYSVRICDSFKQKERHTCKSCYHFVKGAKTNDYYCSKRNLEKLPNSDLCCQYYDGTGETTKHKLDCARASNNSGLCLFFCVSGCPIQNSCPYKIERKENSNLK